MPNKRSPKIEWSHDWWWLDDSGEECRIKMTIDPSKVGRIAGAALRNETGRATSGPFSAVITERRQKQADSE